MQLMMPCVPSVALWQAILGMRLYIGDSTKDYSVTPLPYNREILRGRGQSGHEVHAKAQLTRNCKFNNESYAAWSRM